MREFTPNFTAAITVAVFLFGCGPTGSTPTPLSGKTCVTQKNETGVCSLFKECYPYLGVADMDGTFMNNLLFQQVLESQSLCEGEASDQVRTRDDLICCPNIVELEYDDVVTNGEEDGEETLAEEDNAQDVDSFDLQSPADSEEFRGFSPVLRSQCASPSVMFAPGVKSVANPHSYPFMVSLIKSTKQVRTWFCGGSLIDSRHVLTAAHCLVKFTNKESLKQLTLSLGSHDLTKFEPTRQERGVSTIYKHKKFNLRTIFANDVAIIRLDKPVKFNKYIQPICLASRTRSYEGGEATLAGWGKDCIETCDLSPVLRHIKMPVLTNADCQGKYERSQRVPPSSITSGNICAGRPGADACQGDSGGPLFGTREGRYEQIGIVSWGIGCGLYPGVYARVESFREWIESNIRKP